MGRTVSAMVTWGDTYLGVFGPFPVGVPWWADVEPVVAHLRAVLDVPVLVLRLLAVEGGEGARDGHVTYHVAALDRPAPGLPAERPVDHVVLNGTEELRAPWARLADLDEILTWASDTLAAAGRPTTGAAEQQRTWNLSALFRLPTGTGPVWFKATPRFAADEASVIAAFARVEPALVPLDGPIASELSAGEVAAARGLLSRFSRLDECGLPDTIVHGDFHPGNWRSDGGPPVVVDWADAHLGNPVLDGLRTRDFLPAGSRARHRRTARPAQLRRALPGIPRRHRAVGTDLPPRRSRGGRPGRATQCVSLGSPAAGR